MDAAGGMTRADYTAGFLAGRAGGSLSAGSGSYTAEERQLLKELADPNSTFYTQMRQSLLQKAKKHKEEAEEEALIDAMGVLLDYMCGRTEDKDLRKLAAAGEKLADLSQSQEQLSWQMRLLLMSLSGSGDFAGADEDEEKEETQPLDGGYAGQAVQISGKGADDLPIPSFYDTIYRGGSDPLGDGAVSGVQPDHAARAALWWTGSDPI